MIIFILPAITGRRFFLLLGVFLMAAWGSTATTHAQTTTPDRQQGDRQQGERYSGVGSAHYNELSRQEAVLRARQRAGVIIMEQAGISVRAITTNQQTVTESDDASTARDRYFASYASTNLPAGRLQALQCTIADDRNDRRIDARCSGSVVLYGDGAPRMAVTLYHAEGTRQNCPENFPWQGKGIIATRVKQNTTVCLVVRAQDDGYVAAFDQWLENIDASGVVDARVARIAPAGNDGMIAMQPGSVLTVPLRFGLPPHTPVGEEIINVVVTASPVQVAHIPEIGSSYFATQQAAESYSTFEALLNDPTFDLRSSRVSSVAITVHQ